MAHPPSFSERIGYLEMALEQKKEALREAMANIQVLEGAVRIEASQINNGLRERDTLKERIAYLESERDATLARNKTLMEAVAMAYQFCGARGANEKLLDNLSALADGESAPHPEWPMEDGEWHWGSCGHHSGMSCGQCGAEALARITVLETALREAQAERLQIQRAIARTQTGGDGSEDDKARYTLGEITNHIDLMDKQREDRLHRVVALKQERDAALAQAKQWRDALQMLTPGGSEFLEPGECAKFVRDRMHWRKSTELEARITVLETALSSADSLCDSLNCYIIGLDLLRNFETDMGMTVDQMHETMTIVREAIAKQSLCDMCDKPLFPGSSSTCQCDPCKCDQADQPQSAGLAATLPVTSGDYSGPLTSNSFKFTPGEPSPWIIEGQPQTAPSLGHKTHELKCWPEFFDAVQNWEKLFEIRHNDCEFKVGDILWLREWSHSTNYTGREVRRGVSYITDFPAGLVDGYVCMGLQTGPSGDPVHAENCNTNRLRSNEPDALACNCGAEPGGEGTACQMCKMFEMALRNIEYLVGIGQRHDTLNGKDIALSAALNIVHQLLPAQPSDIAEPTKGKGE